MLTKKEKIIFDVLKLIIEDDIKPTMITMKKEVSKKGLKIKSNNSLCQYYLQLQLKEYIKIIPFAYLYVSTTIFVAIDIGIIIMIMFKFLINS